MRKFLLFTLFCTAIFAGVSCAAPKENQTDENTEPQETQTVEYTVKFACSDAFAGVIEGETEQTVSAGEYTETVTAKSNLGYKFVGWTNGESSEELTLAPNSSEEIFALFEIDAKELPIMVINTEDGAAITSKDEYVNCLISVINADEEFEFADAAAEIRGRGNSTWNMPKKPYKLKFGSKVDLFGNGKAKKWTLIANYCDPSLVRNDLAYAVGSLFDELDGYTTLTQNVELFVNGRYDGVYTVCEQVEVGKTRINIAEDIYDKKTDGMIEPEDVGYLIEMDVRAPEEGVEGTDYFVIDEMSYAIKSPDTEDERFSGDYVEYIKTYFETCYAAVCGDEWNAVVSLMDAESFAATYIVHELFNCVDCWQCSVYFYKVQNGKLFSGPLWDFDISSGNCNYFADVNSPECLWAKEQNVWYGNLLRFDEFKAIVKSQLDEYGADIVSTIDGKIQEFLGQQGAFIRNFDRWIILGKYVWPNPDEICSIDSWQEQLNYLVDWLKQSLDFLIAEYC